MTHDKLLCRGRNKQAMTINQAWHGHPGTLVATLPPTPPACPACAEPGTAVVGVPCDTTDKTQQGWAFDAAVGHIMHGDLCLSAQEWGIPLNLYTCGNGTTIQNFTYDAETKQFQTHAPANGKGMYPASLEIAPGPGIQKAYVYRPGASLGFQFAVESGSISNGNNQCLAARGEYMPPAVGVAGVQIWAKPLGPGKAAALFINGGATPYSASISLKELNITTPAVCFACCLRPHASFWLRLCVEWCLWQGSPEGVHPTAVSVTDVWGDGLSGQVIDGNWSTGEVPSLDSRFVVLSSA
eukprot:SAG31_NODE_2433_length_5706_cov_2.207776_4_plen_297_part_00